MMMTVVVGRAAAAEGGGRMLRAASINVAVQLRGIFFRILDKRSIEAAGTIDVRGRARAREE
jgi:hypothetical protein